MHALVTHFGTLLLPSSEPILSNSQSPSRYAKAVGPRVRPIPPIVSSPLRNGFSLVPGAVIDRRAGVRARCRAAVLARARLQEA